MKKMIEIQNLVYEYKKNDGESTKALKGINLEIEQGEFVVVIGHNGSGKSTLAKHINAILLPIIFFIFIYQVLYLNHFFHDIPSFTK